MPPLPKVIVSVEPVQAQITAQPISRFQIRRVEGALVTRDLPATISAREAAGVRTQTPGTSLMRPSIDVPAYEIDYPVVDVPTQAEFDEAVKGHNKDTKSKETDDAAPAKDLAAKVPIPQIMVPPQPDAQLQATEVPTAAIPAINTNAADATPTAKTGTEVTLPFLGAVPMPSREALTLASTTAVTATFVAVVGKAVMETSLEGAKPLARLAVIRLKKLTNNDLSHQEVQLDFARQLVKKNTRHNFFSDVLDYVRKHFIGDLIG